ncbi:MAG: phosphopyruvate hydratase [Patescibacteria group bacterium]
MSKDTIKKITAREILDSRGDPTVEVTVEVVGGTKATAAVPSGASTGKHEAHELRDNDKKRYGGKGVLKAIKNVNTEINKLLKGKDVIQQSEIDKQLIELDGTKNKERIGANAILGTSLACARAGSLAVKVPLYKYIRQTFSIVAKDFPLPHAMINLVNGGRHADSNLEIQEIMIIPQIYSTGGEVNIKECVRLGSEVFHALGKIFNKEKLDIDLGNEGGYAPDFRSYNQPFDLLLQAINKAGFEPGKQVALGLDVAASEFYSNGKYDFQGQQLSADGLISLYEEWLNRWPIISLEDGLHEDDWSGWIKLTKKFKDKCNLVGDDLFVTNINRLRMGVELGAANAIIIKFNQIGTLSETITTTKFAQDHGYKIVVSHRSGETADTFIADLAVAVKADFLKAGSVARGERVAKYNRLIEIATELNK